MSQNENNSLLSLTYKVSQKRPIGTDKIYLPCFSALSYEQTYNHKYEDTEKRDSHRRLVHVSRHSFRIHELDSLFIITSILTQLVEIYQDEYPEIVDIADEVLSTACLMLAPTQEFIFTCNYHGTITHSKGIMYEKKDIQNLLSRSDIEPIKPSQENIFDKKQLRQRMEKSLTEQTQQEDTKSADDQKTIEPTIYEEGIHRQKIKPSNQSPPIPKTGIQAANNGKKTSHPKASYSLLNDDEWGDIIASTNGPILKEIAQRIYNKQDYFVISCSMTDIHAYETGGGIAHDVLLVFQRKSNPDSKSNIYSLTIQDPISTAVNENKDLLQHFNKAVPMIEGALKKYGITNLKIKCKGYDREISFQTAHYCSLHMAYNIVKFKLKKGIEEKINENKKNNNTKSNLEKLPKNPLQPLCTDDEKISDRQQNDAQLIKALNRSYLHHDKKHIESFIRNQLIFKPDENNLLVLPSWKDIHSKQHDDEKTNSISSTYTEKFCENMIKAQSENAQLTWQHALTAFPYLEEDLTPCLFNPDVKKHTTLKKKQQEILISNTHVLRCFPVMIRNKDDRSSFLYVLLYLEKDPEKQTLSIQYKADSNVDKDTIEKLIGVLKEPLSSDSMNKSPVIQVSKLPDDQTTVSSLELTAQTQSKIISDVLENHPEYGYMTTQQRARLRNKDKHLDKESTNTDIHQEKWSPNKPPSKTDNKAKNNAILGYSILLFILADVVLGLKMLPDALASATTPFLEPIVLGFAALTLFVILLSMIFCIRLYKNKQGDHRQDISVHHPDELNARKLSSTEQKIGPTISESKENKSLPPQNQNTPKHSKQNFPGKQ